MHKTQQAQGVRSVYESPQVEVFTMTADAAIMQTSGSESEIPDLGSYDGMGDIVWDIL